MGELHELLIETVIAEAVDHGKHQINEADLVKRMKEIAPAFAESAATTILDQIKRDAKVGLRRHRREQQTFERRLQEHWAMPLHLLEITIELAYEVAARTGDRVRAGEISVDKYTFQSLWAIHARACQMSRAIVALLRSGYPDDAHARWRTLHELAAVSLFIGKHGEEIAERYLLHDVVQRRKLARAYKKHEIRANLEPLTEMEIDKIEDEYQSLVRRFGHRFGKDYGWAAHALGNKPPTLENIEIDVELDHLRPYYQMANNNVHGNSHAAFFKLGGFEPDRDILLAGPSNMGLADPGHGVAWSLTQVTEALEDAAPTFDGLIELMALNLLQEETGEAFFRAHEQAETIAEDRLRQRSLHDHIVQRPHWRSRLVSGVRDRLAALLYD